jgi:hypothetical protein
MSIYGWVIEFGNGCAAFIRRDDRHDQAYVEQRAADLHGVWFPVFREVP